MSELSDVPSVIPLDVAERGFEPRLSGCQICIPSCTRHGRERLGIEQKFHH